MPDYIKPLGDTIRKARTELGYTQTQVAERIGIDSRTVLNIENYKGNSKMAILYPLLRELKVDPNDIFYPELQRGTSAIKQLRLLIEECSEDEAKLLIPVVQAVMAIINGKNTHDV